MCAQTKINFIIVYIVSQKGIKFKRCSVAQFSISVFEATVLGLKFRETKSFDDFHVPFNFNFNHATRQMNLKRTENVKNNRRWVETEICIVSST